MTVNRNLGIMVLRKGVNIKRIITEYGDDDECACHGNGSCLCNEGVNCRTVK